MTVISFSLPSCSQVNIDLTFLWLQYISILETTDTQQLYLSHHPVMLEIPLNNLKKVHFKMPNDAVTLQSGASDGFLEESRVAKQLLSWESYRCCWPSCPPSPSARLPASTMAVPCTAFHEMSHTHLRCCTAELSHLPTRALV